MRLRDHPFLGNHWQLRLTFNIIPPKEVNLTRQSSMPSDNITTGPSRAIKEPSCRICGSPLRSPTDVRCHYCSAPFVDEDQPPPTLVIFADHPFWKLLGLHLSFLGVPLLPIVGVLALVHARLTARHRNERIADRFLTSLGIVWAIFLVSGITGAAAFGVICNSQGGQLTSILFEVFIPVLCGIAVFIPMFALSVAAPCETQPQQHLFDRWRNPPPPPDTPKERLIARLRSIEYPLWLLAAFLWIKSLGVVRVAETIWWIRSMEIVAASLCFVCMMLHGAIVVTRWRYK
jgi:hypothetical protein